MKINVDGLGKRIIKINLRKHCNTHITLKQKEGIKITTDALVGKDCLYLNLIDGKFIIDGPESIIWPDSPIRRVSDK